MSIEKTIQDQKNQHAILLYMKGTPDQPQCGFSKKAVDYLKLCNAHFESVNILEYPEIRASLKSSGWPTFPQLYIKGELIGGSDIIESLYQTGELQNQLKV